ncbi:hypothetical protein ACHAXM_001829 [Skeletonema potamos]
MTSAAEGKLQNFGLRKQGNLQAKGAESVILPQWGEEGLVLCLALKIKCLKLTSVAEDSKLNFCEQGRFVSVES